LPVCAACSARNAGEQRNWLLFGERNRAHDLLCGDELQAGWTTATWHAGPGVFADQAEKVYVQDVLLQQAAEFKRWVAEAPVCMSAAACKAWLRGWMRRCRACLVKLLCSS
jgi:sulfite reductase alpha subunit-like flavoprotein